MISHIQHVAIEVDDLDAAVSFYGRLGLTPIDRPASLGEGGAWLGAGTGAPLHLTATPDFRPPATSQHIAFEVTDLATVVDSLRAGGIEVSDPFDIGAGNQAFLRDPAGNLLELNQPTT